MLTKVAGDVVDSFQVGFTVTETIMTAMIASVGIVIVALINKMGNRTAKLERQSKEIHHEVRSNGGGSMKDGIDRTERTMAEMMHKQDLTFERVGAITRLIDINAENITVLRDDSVKVHTRLDGLGRAVDRKADRPPD